MKIQTFYFSILMVFAGWVRGGEVYRGWEGALRLENEAMRIVVVPQIGRMVHLSRQGGESLLSFREDLAGQLPPAEEGDWFNYGGDWLWPVHQDRWEAMGGGQWPPLRMMDGPPWRGERTVNPEGGGEIVLRRDYGAPLFLQVERRFVLGAGAAATLRVEQTARRIYASPIPVTLWHLTQIAGAEAAWMGRPSDSRFDRGFHQIAFEAPGEEHVTVLPEAVLYHAGRSGEHKLGTDGRWIAARRGGDVLLQWAEGGDAGGAFPDGGSSVVLFSHAGLGYTEIETQSVEIDLAPGEAHRNTVVYQLFAAPEGVDDVALTEQLLERTPAREVIQFSPAGATAGDRITVRVRSPEPGGVLHWGVNGPGGNWELPHPATWPEGSRAGATGVAVDTPLPDPVDGVSTLELGPFTHPEQVVGSLHAVARWGDRWESRGGENYNLFFAVHPDAAQLTLTVEEDGEGLRVEVRSTPAAEDLRVRLGGEEVHRGQGEGMRLTLDLRELDYGPHPVQVRAERGGQISSARTEVWRVPTLPDPLDFPFGGLPFGATRGEDGDWRVVLFAPNARFVEVEWKTAAEEIRRELMIPATDGQWVLTLAGAPDVLQYRYVVDGRQRFADPWSVDVLWWTEDGRKGHLPEQAWTLAGSLPPPMGPWDRPPMETWVIYELNIPDVAPPGSYTGLKAKLDYIAGLGINAIEPLPVTTFPGEESWGYNPAFHMGLERSYGTPEEFAALIQAMRDRGIAFVFDIVLNHIDGNSPMYRMHGPSEKNPFFVPFDGFNWGFPKLDQESPAFQRYVADTLRHWILQWGVDGYRYDATQWIQWSGYKDWGVSWMAYVVHQTDPGVVQIAENLPSEPDMVKGTELDSEWDGHYRWRMRRVFVEGNFFGEPGKMREILDPRNHAYQTGWQRMQYIESHDEERFVRELQEAGYTEEEALRRHLSAAAVTLTVPGIPFLFSGQEWGETTRKHVGWNPLQWERREEPARAAMLERFRELIHLRTRHRSLHHDRIDVLTVDDAKSAVLYVRPGVPESVLVAFTVSREPVTLAWPGGWEVVEEVAAADGATAPDGQITLAAGQARVFRVRRR